MKLKTIIGTALLAGTCALPASAQIGEQRHSFSVGINGGINLNSVSFSPRVRQNNLMGINGGVTARYISEKYFSMICGAQIELNFSQHGWDEFYEDYPELQYTRKMNYLEIPFLAHLAFGKDRGLQFFVHAGPQIGFFLGDSYTISGDWDNYPGLTVEQHDKAVDNRFDYGIRAEPAWNSHQSRKFPGGRQILLCLVRLLQQYQEGLLFPFGTRSHHRKNHLFVRFKEIKKITV